MSVYKAAAKCGFLQLEEPIRIQKKEEGAFCKNTGLKDSQNTIP